jgi:hypothetical protein
MPHLGALHRIRRMRRTIRGLESKVQKVSNNQRPYKTFLNDFNHSHFMFFTTFNFLLSLSAKGEN